MTARSVTGRPSTPVPGQDASGDSVLSRPRRPSKEDTPQESRNLPSQAVASRGGMHVVDLTQLTRGAAGPGRSMLPTSKTGKEAMTAAERVLARRKSGSPEPGSAARNNWQLGGNGGRRGPAERVRTSPISEGATARRLSPSSPKDAAPQSKPLPSSPLCTSWGWRPTSFHLDAPQAPALPGQRLPSDGKAISASVLRLGVPETFVKAIEVTPTSPGQLDGQNVDADGITEEEWREFEESRAELKKQAVWLKGWLKSQYEFFPDWRDHLPQREEKLRQVDPGLDEGQCMGPPPQRLARGRENRSPRQSPRQPKRAAKMGANREEGQGDTSAYGWSRSKEDTIAGANLIAEPGADLCVDLQNHTVGGC